jgi:hypothetical protein
VAPFGRHGILFRRRQERRFDIRRAHGNRRQLGPLGRRHRSIGLPILFARLGEPRGEARGHGAARLAATAQATNGEASPVLLKRFSLSECQE